MLCDWTTLPTEAVVLKSVSFLFWDMVSFLCSSSYPGTSSVDKTGLELKDFTAPVSWMLRLKAEIKNWFLILNTYRWHLGVYK